MARPFGEPQAQFPPAMDIPKSLRAGATLFYKNGRTFVAPKEDSQWSVNALP